MSLVDEVEGLIAYATAYVANLDPAFKPRYPEGDLAKHGPAILAGLRLANAHMQRKDCRSYGLADFSEAECAKGRAAWEQIARANAALVEAEAAYRAALAQIAGRLGHVGREGNQ